MGNPLQSLIVKLRTLIPVSGLLTALLLLILRSRQQALPPSEPGTWAPIE